MDYSKHIRVLLIEDNPGDTRLIREVLAEVEGMSFDLEWADRLSMGLDRLGGGGVDAVLLDLSLPDSYGLDTFTKVHIQAPGVPIIVLTGLDDQDVALNAVRGGAQDYLIKGQLDGNLLARAIRYAIERRRAEEKIQQQNEFLNGVLESLSNPLYVIDVHDYTVKMANSAAGLGSLAEGVACYALTHRSNRPCGAMEHPCPIEEIKRTEGPVTVEHIHHDKDGNLRNIEVHAYPIFDGEGNVVQIIEYCLDITERKHAEEKLRDALEESRRRQAEISALLEGSRSVLEYREFQNSARSIFDSCKNLIGATAGYVALLAADGTENEVLFLDSGGLPCTVDPSLPMPIRGLRGEAYRTGKVVYSNEFSESEWMKYMPEGHVSLDNVLFAPLMIEGDAVGLLGIASKPGGFTGNDARLASAFGELAAIALHNSRTLELLENSEQRFRSVVQTANDAIVVIDSRGDIVFWNYGAETIFGYSTGEALGKPVTSIMPERFHRVHRNGMNRAVSTGESNIIGKTTEVGGLRKDGSEFPIELSLATWKARGEMFFTAIIRDITRRKEEEARKVAEQELEKQRVLTMRSDRLRSLGEMAAGISHELNQPLVGVRGLAEHLMISIDRGWEVTEEKVRDRAKMIVEQADRMVHIIEHVRMFAREAGNPEFRPVHVNEVVRSGMDMLGTQFRSRGIQLEYEFTEPLPVVSANPFSLEEVVINLLINARDAVEEQLRVGSVLAPPRILLRTLKDQADSKEYVKIEVVDSGAGIPEQIIEKVFDPFFTTKGPDRGTGLGLSICKSIVEGFGGTIHIQSMPAEGTTVAISLPVA